MASAMDYLMQVASFGFLGGYFSICLAGRSISSGRLSP